MALVNNNIILVFIFLFEGLFSDGAFSIIFYISSLGLAALNVSEIKTPKLSVNRASVYFLAIYTLGITGIYTWKLL
jgi:CDP-diacylglycerol--serine O-phosphatidyltransferase